jgi:hypothetical protein
MHVGFPIWSMDNMDMSRALPADVHVVHAGVAPEVLRLGNALLVHPNPWREHTLRIRICSVHGRANACVMTEHGILSMWLL